MPKSPKRWALIMDDQKWPRRVSPLNLAYAASTESLDTPMPSSPAMEATPVAEIEVGEPESLFLPGFHFSTTDASVDPAEFHRMAASLLSGEVSKRTSTQYVPPDETATERHMHCDLGKDSTGRCCCSCGKSYSTFFRLHEHIQQCAGVNNFPCQSCDKVFTTQEKLDRHISSRHNSNQESCPECGQLFPSTYLPKHLASGAGGCDGMVQASQAPDVDPSYKPADTKTASQQYWIYQGNHDWKQDRADRHDSGLELDQNSEVIGQTIDFVKRLLTRPDSQPNRVVCDLCGDWFTSQSDDLAEHIGRHSLDFTEKSHKCDECRIFFAHDKDLERHLQSANLNQHCGFTFRHNNACTGHHPPTYFKTSVANDHNLMQKHLWAWELSQLRTHRAAVARILAEQLSQTANPHMSLADCKRTYISLLPHFSVASARSSTGSGWIDDQDAEELSSLDAHFTRVIDETYPTAAMAKLRVGEKASKARPDSPVIAGDPVEPKEPRPLSRRRSLLGLAKRAALEQVKNGHKRQVLSASGFALLRSQTTAKDDTSRPSSLPTVKLTA